MNMSHLAHLVHIIALGIRICFSIFFFNHSSQADGFPYFCQMFSELKDFDRKYSKDRSSLPSIVKSVPPILPQAVNLSYLQTRVNRYPFILPFHLENVFEVKVTPTYSNYH